MTKNIIVRDWSLLFLFGLDVYRRRPSKLSVSHAGKSLYAEDCLINMHPKGTAETGPDIVRGGGRQ